MTNRKKHKSVDYAELRKQKWTKVLNILSNGRNTKGGMNNEKIS